MLWYFVTSRVINVVPRELPGMDPELLHPVRALCCLHSEYVLYCPFAYFVRFIRAFYIFLVQPHSKEVTRSDSGNSCRGITIY